MIDLRQGDCLEVMKEIEDNSINLIVTDPPYLINYSRHVKGHRFENKILNDNNPELISNYIKECYRILKDNSAMYMFTSHKTVDFFKIELEEAGFNVKNMIIWDKQRQGMGDTATVFGFQYELIFFVSKGQPKIRGKRISDIWSFPKVVGKNQLHQNQKPIELIEQCIQKHSDEGDLVFDGFMGSGTTGVACVNTNRNFIGIELDDKYFEIAKERINELKNT
jgi:site-specific DNA-methyltransferase (adenine-specific)